MESIQMFTVFMLAMAALHLAAKSFTQIQDWWNKKVFSDADAHPGGGGFNTVGIAPSVPLQPRNDWYVFFHCSALTGEKTLPVQPVARKGATLSSSRPSQRAKKSPPRMVAR